jgi:hypothetical protein
MLLIAEILKILVFMIATSALTDHLERPISYRNINKEAVIHQEKKENKRHKRK